ncbi:hypothetical protein [Thalassotalea atypica]|uniref:hypothetical protein n=1 Tax=Thalassotalea atypica TaxID=2054316 RepID=UPI00257417B9|nr:hypothetical protein [Thalassotalea atypica]
MEIQSAFNAGLQGFQNATERANEAATNIVQETTRTEAAESFSPEQQINSEPQVQNRDAGDVIDLNQEIVDLKVAEFQAKASAEVVQTADEVLGTLIDVTA